MAKPHETQTGCPPTRKNFTLAGGHPVRASRSPATLNRNQLPFSRCGRPHLCPVHARRTDAVEQARGLRSLGFFGDFVMAFKNPSKSAQGAAQTGTPKAPARVALTLEALNMRGPRASVAENVARAFALEPVDFDATRDAAKAALIAWADTLTPAVNQFAMRVLLDRMVNAVLSSADGAINFYGEKVSQARDLTAKLNNEDRDEDREPVWGFETKAERARQFAAEACLAAFAQMAAAHGAVAAYEHVTGETWKPYTPPAAPARSVSRQAAKAELEAFGG
jgi:hypothetical protein